MNKIEFDTLLDELGACEEARAFCNGRSLAQAWRMSDRGDWMLWLCSKMVDRSGWPTRQELVLAACDCAELSLKYVPAGEDRPAKAIATARKWANGKASLQEVRNAANAAYAAYAANATAYAAANAAYAAYAAAYAAYAANATAYAAANAAAYAAANAAASKTLKQCARIVRKALSVPVGRKK